MCIASSYKNFSFSGKKKKNDLTLKHAEISQIICGPENIIAYCKRLGTLLKTQNIVLAFLIPLISQKRRNTGIEQNRFITFIWLKIKNLNHEIWNTKTVLSNEEMFSKRHGVQEYTKGVGKARFIFQAIFKYFNRLF